MKAHTLTPQKTTSGYRTDSKYKAGLYKFGDAKSGNAKELVNTVYEVYSKGNGKYYKLRKDWKGEKYASTGKFSLRQAITELFNFKKSGKRGAQQLVNIGQDIYNNENAALKVRVAAYDVWEAAKGTKHGKKTEELTKALRELHEALQEEAQLPNAGDDNSAENKVFTTIQPVDLQTDDDVSTALIEDISVAEMSMYDIESQESSNSVEIGNDPYDKYLVKIGLSADRVGPEMKTSVFGAFSRKPYEPAAAKYMLIALIGLEQRFGNQPPYATAGDTQDTYRWLKHTGDGVALCLSADPAKPEAACEGQGPREFVLRRILNIGLSFEDFKADPAIAKAGETLVDLAREALNNSEKVITDRAALYEALATLATMDNQHPHAEEFQKHYEHQSTISREGRQIIERPKTSKQMRDEAASLLGANSVAALAAPSHESVVSMFEYLYASKYVLDKDRVYVVYNLNGDQLLSSQPLSQQSYTDGDFKVTIDKKPSIDGTDGEDTGKTALWVIQRFADHFTNHPDEQVRKAALTISEIVGATRNTNEPDQQTIEISEDLVKAFHTLALHGVSPEEYEIMKGAGLNSTSAQ